MAPTSSRAARCAPAGVDLARVLRSSSGVVENASTDRRFILFVYGTLLSGEPSPALLDGARAHGPATTDSSARFQAAAAFGARDAPVVRRARNREG